MAFGLISLLVTVGVIVLIMKVFYIPYTEAALKAREKADSQLNVISGRDSDTGKRIEVTYTLFPDSRSDGKLADFQVSHLDSDSPMIKVFGLKENDVILAAWDTHDVRTDIAGSNDPDSARLAVREAYTGMASGAGKLLIQRGDKKMILPGEKPVDDRGNLTFPPEMTTAQSTGQSTAQPATQPAQLAPPAKVEPPPADDNDPLKALRDLRRSNPGM
jgi:hypothetical protein